jgi:hypothetical protein
VRALLSGQFHRAQPHLVRYRIYKVMPNVISGIRKKFTRAGLDKLEEYLLPHKGRIGIKVQLETDLFSEDET